MRHAILLALLLTAGCATMNPVDAVTVVPLSDQATPPAAVPLDSVRFVEPAPNCPAVARLTNRTGAANAQFGLEALRMKAASLGANRLFVTVTDGGADQTLGVSVPMIMQSALALRCP